MRDGHGGARAGARRAERRGLGGIDIDDEDEIVSTLGDGEAMGAGGGGGRDDNRDGWLSAVGGEIF